jgi:hypothetical protein
MNDDTQPTKRLYKVEIGHNSVMVESATPEDAIRAARTKLSLEMPRLWDIIQKLAPEKFNVSMVY